VSSIQAEREKRKNGVIVVFLGDNLLPQALVASGRHHPLLRACGLQGSTEKR
jgi:hypothetical protein